MKKINFNHSLIFFNFCIFLSPFYLLLNFEPIIFCLVLILILGISHGALDNVKGKKLLQLFGYKSSFFFYLTYIIISLVIIFLSKPTDKSKLVLLFNESIIFSAKIL